MGPQTYISCTPDQPLYVTAQDYLSEQEFLELQDEVRGHRNVGNNALNADNFQKTEGFVVKFNSEGVRRLKADPSLKSLIKYFNKIRDPAANAWVLNVLLCMPGGGDEDEEDSTALSVSPHVDETLGHMSPDSFMAHVVNVLYVSIPRAMSGGRLEMYGYSWLRVQLFPYLLSFLSTSQLDRIIPPDARVEPSENLLVSFRGDMIHRVEGYRMRAEVEEETEKKETDVRVWCWNNIVCRLLPTSL